MEKEVRDRVFHYLIHHPEAKFSELLDKSMPSNKFTYHLNEMIKEGLIEKVNDGYSLTTKGKNLESDIDGATGKKRQKPFVALLLVVKADDKFLLYHRLKEPYYGFYGFPGAKLDFGEEILTAANRELKEETGLDGQGKIISIFNVKTFESDNPLAHFTQFVVLFDNTSGELIHSSREGEYSLENKQRFDELHSQNKLFPDAMLIIDKIVKDKSVHLYELIIRQGKDTFTGFDYKQVF